MHIELRGFATLAVYVPRNAEDYALADGASVAGLISGLGIPPAEVKIIFVNGVRCEPDRVLLDGDRVGLFPAVGGG